MKIYNQLNNQYVNLHAFVVSKLQNLIKESRLTELKVLLGQTFLDPDTDSQVHEASKLKVTQVNADGSIHGSFYQGECNVYDLKSLTIEDLLNLLLTLQNRQERKSNNKK